MRVAGRLLARTAPAPILRSCLRIAGVAWASVGLRRQVHGMAVPPFSTPFGEWASLPFHIARLRGNPFRLAWWCRNQFLVPVSRFGFGGRAFVGWWWCGVLLVAADAPWFGGGHSEK